MSKPYYLIFVPIFVSGNPWKDGNEGDSKVQFQKDTLVIFASAEDDNNWQGITLQNNLHTIFPSNIN